LLVSIFVFLFLYPLIFIQMALQRFIDFCPQSSPIVSPSIPTISPLFLRTDWYTVISFQKFNTLNYFWVTRTVSVLLFLVCSRVRKLKMERYPGIDIFILLYTLNSRFGICFSCPLLL
jgi:hypothetical protein